MKATLSWVWFAVVELISFVAMVVGWVLLIPFCLLHLWGKPKYKSIKDGRLVDRFYLIGFVYFNPEDGNSGRQALINGNQPYMPSKVTNLILKWLIDAWRAYAWSAGRNSCDNLKYLFAWKSGPPAIEKPYRLFWVWKRTLKVGYQFENGYNVPVFSP